MGFTSLWLARNFDRNQLLGICLEGPDTLSFSSGFLRLESSTTRYLDPVANLGNRTQAQSRPRRPGPWTADRLPGLSETLRLEEPKVGPICRFLGPEVGIMYMAGCQNYGPLLGPLNTRCVLE